MKTCFWIERGWVTENKRTKLGDGETLEQCCVSGRAEADRVFEAFVAKCRGTEDRGEYLARDTVDLWELDENNDPAGQPLRSYISH